MSVPQKRREKGQNNGLAERTARVHGDEGILVMDRDGDGLIISGQELSAIKLSSKIVQKAVSGFLALADLGTNKGGNYQRFVCGY